MPAEIGKWNLLEVDNQFATLTVKCYLCKHWTILRIPIDALKDELEEPERAIEKEVSGFLSKVKESE